MPRKRKPKGRKAGKKRRVKHAKVARMKALKGSRKALKRRIKTKHAKVEKIISRKPRIAPLHGSFFITSFIGLIVTILFVIPNSLSWGTALLVFFIIMIAASIVSMARAPHHKY